MPIQTILGILNSYSRLLEFLNNNGYDDMIENIKENYTTLIITIRGHQGETYDVEVWNSYTTGELCVENPITHQSFFDVAAEFGMTEEDINYIKYGRKGEKTCS